MTGRVIVVTGTGTGVGKTIATAALAVQASGTGSVLVVKPVQTGMGPEHAETPDVEVIHTLAGCEALELTTLDDPLAPDTAARRQGVHIPAVSDHAARIRALSNDYDSVLVEGAGGLLVRLDTDGGTVLDLATQLDAEVIVVVTAGLGTLNHTELTVAALRARGIEPTGLIIGAWPHQPGLAETCNRVDLPQVSGLPVLAAIPAGAGDLGGATFKNLAPSWFF